MNIKFFVLEQAPVLSPEQMDQEVDWLGATAIEWLKSRLLELWFTNVELEAFARDLGFGGRPFIWNKIRRLAIQAEIDAAMLHLYGLTREQSEWVLNSFTVLRKYEERDHNEFRTKRLVLAAYDAMAEAKAARTAYISPLSPPPADPSLCHPSSAEDTPLIELPVLDSLPNSAWTWPATIQPRDRLRYAAQYALWQMVPATDGAHIRFVIASLAEPALLTPMLTGAERDQWVRLAGPEALPLQGVVRLRPAINQAWRSMFEILITSGQLAESANGAWVRGQHFGTAGLDANSSHAQRAAFAMAAVRAMEIGKLASAVAQEDNVIWERFGHG